MPESYQQLAAKAERLAIQLTEAYALIKALEAQKADRLEEMKPGKVCAWIVALSPMGVMIALLPRVMLGVLCGIGVIVIYVSAIAFLVDTYGE